MHGFTRRQDRETILVRHIDHPVPARWCLTTCMFANKHPRLSSSVGHGLRKISSSCYPFTYPTCSAPESAPRAFY